MMRPQQLVVLAAVLLGSQSAAAFGVGLQNGHVVRWPHNAVTYWLDADGTSDITDGSDLAAVRTAVQSWNAVGCSTFTLTEAGTTFSTQNVVTDNVTDGKNVVVWVNDSRWSFGQLVLGVTAPVFDANGNISEADVAFNGYSAQWSTDGDTSGGKIDVQSVAVHELGHFLGLAHVLGGESLADPPTMSPTVLPDLESRSLNADDMSGACFLYPKTPYLCAGDCDCPTIVDRNASGQEFNAGQEVCDAGTCSTGTANTTGSGALGASCLTSDTCTSGLFCQPTTYGSYCAQSCDPTQSNCPAGFDCWPYSDSTGGACMASSLGTGSSSTGAICQASVAPAPSGSTSGTTSTGSPRRPSSDTSGGGTTSGTGSGASSNAGFVPACACDTNYDCTPNCSCDPDCSGGCAALPQTGAAGTTTPFILLLFGIVFGVARRRRTR